MSHEGIRIVSAEEAQQEQVEVKTSPDAVTPAKVRVKKSEGTGMEIDWRDGHLSVWSFFWLRHACPCATCHEERDATGRKPGEPKPKPATLLPMYEPPIKPLEVSSVGKYAAFQVERRTREWNLLVEYLRKQCACEKCKGRS